MRRVVQRFMAGAALWMAVAGAAGAEAARVLWWDGSPPYPNATNAADREKMARFLDGYGGGGVFDVTFRHSRRQGALAMQMDGQGYDIVVLDVTSKTVPFGAGDMAAVRAFYRGGKRALILDGTLWIRSTRTTPETRFPGPNGAAGALLVNQVMALKEQGGGLLVGTDHDEYQAGANRIVDALLPGVAFSGRTNPSRDGDFVGDVLLRQVESARPIDILRHWESVPSQAEAPVGTYRDFMGNAVTLHALVETSDKPGGRQKRPYISASFPPGDRRTAIDSDTAPEPEGPPMPTRKSVVE
ncbi:MAG: hypothetical protein RI571_02320 [Roseovarius sp.]|nr:hypothetical protein [Roseovarius sp.]